MKRSIYLLVIIVTSLIAVGCAQNAAPSLAGTYNWTVSKAQSAQQGWTGDLICENAGNFQMVFAPTGSTTMTQTPVEDCDPAAVNVLVGTWKVSGDQLTYTEITDSGCGVPVVVYKWNLQGNTLTLNKVSDTCQFSASDTAPKVWTKTH